MEVAEHEKLVSRDELAEILGVKPWWVQQAASEGRIPGYRTKPAQGGKWKFRVSEVLDAMRSKQFTGSAG